MSFWCAIPDMVANNLLSESDALDFSQFLQGCAVCSISFLLLIRKDLQVERDRPTAIPSFI